MIYSSAEMALRMERHAARGVAYEARMRKRDLQVGVTDAVSALTALFDAGVDRNFLDDTIAGLIDAADNVDAECFRAIDNAGEHADPIDLSEVHALLEKVRG